MFCLKIIGGIKVTSSFETSCGMCPKKDAYSRHFVVGATKKNCYPTDGFPDFWIFISLCEKEAFQKELERKEWDWKKGPLL